MTAPRKLTDAYLATLVDEEVVLIGIDGGELLSLKGTGRAVWDLIDGQRDRDAIVAALLADYAEMRDVIEADVAELLADLAAAGLVDE